MFFFPNGIWKDLLKLINLCNRKIKKKGARNSNKLYFVDAAKIQTS